MHPYMGMYVAMQLLYYVSLYRYVCSYACTVHPYIEMYVAIRVLYYTSLYRYVCSYAGTLLYILI